MKISVPAEKPEHAWISPGKAGGERAVVHVAPQQLRQVLCHLHGVVTPHTWKKGRSHLNIYYHGMISSLIIISHSVFLSHLVGRQVWDPTAPEHSFPTGGYQWLANEGPW